MRIYQNLFKLNLHQQINAAAILFLFIPVLLFAIFFISPIIYTLYLSFHEWNGLSVDMKPVGFENYLNLAKDKYFVTALVNNAKWLVFYVTIPPALALIFALIVHEKVKGRNLFEIVFFIPTAFTLVAVSSIFRWLYNPGFGVLNSILKTLGFQVLSQNWLGNPKIATYSIMVAALWSGTGVPFLIYLAGLQYCPKELIDAAKIDGASYWQRFRYVMWPMLAPSTIIVFAMSTVSAVRVFDLIYSMSTRGTEFFTAVLSVYMYERSFHAFQMGQGAAGAVLLFLLAGFIISPYLIYSRRNLEKIEQ